MDLGSREERGLTADVPVAMTCAPICWRGGSNAHARACFGSVDIDVDRHKVGAVGTLLACVLRHIAPTRLASLPST